MKVEPNCRKLAYAFRMSASLILKAFEHLFDRIAFVAVS